jgi:hypothetical protein
LWPGVLSNRHLAVELGVNDDRSPGSQMIGELQRCTVDKSPRAGVQDDMARENAVA